MDATQYELVCSWVNRLIELPEPERRARLDVLRHEQSDIARLIEEMLAADAQANRSLFLVEPIQAGSTEFRIDETVTVKESVELPADDERLIGRRIRCYRLDKKIGAGGMGVVYRATDLNSEREVAIKLIRPGELADAEHIRRFQAEAIAAARMQHPNIVPVYDVGRDQRYEYFTMRLVEGEDLGQRLKQGPLPLRETARLFLQLAQALAYAHTQGVVHRDIKPANILLDEQNVPLLTDFGIAKRLDAPEQQTGTGQVLGTLVYMAPEQIESSKQVGPSADLYALGATLYECLCGKPPFASRTVIQLLNAVRLQSPQSIRESRPEVDRDLEAICLRCLEKAPADRYESASHLAADLTCFLAGEPLASKPLSRWSSVGRILNFRDQNESFASSGVAAWMIFLAATFHPLVFIVNAAQLSVIYLWLLLGTWAVTVSFMTYRYYWRQYWQLSSTERQSGLVQLACHLSFACLFLTSGPLNFSQRTSDFLNVYPPFCVVIAVAIWAHAGIHAGRWIILGSFFFPLSVACHVLPFWSPLLFGLTGASVAAAIAFDVNATLGLPSNRASHEHLDAKT